MKKFFLVLLIILGIHQISFGQDFPWGAMTIDEINMKKYDRDTSAHAVVLQEFGSSRIDVVSDESVKLVFEYHVKIKIFDEKGFESAKVKINLSNNSDNYSYETVSEISGTTYYYDQSGNVEKTDLDQSKIYYKKIDNHFATSEFALSGLKSGCIIEYKYRVESPYFRNLQTWPFQSNIPKIYSQYDVHIPAYWRFNASLKGQLNLTKNSAVIEPRCFIWAGLNCDCSYLVFGMANIPAFIEEDYMTSPKNFISSVNFEAQDFTDPHTGIKTLYTNDWKDIDYKLKNQDEVGGQVKRKGLFKDRVIPVIAGKTSDLEKAKAIYQYIQQHYKWNTYKGIYSIEGLGKAFDHKSGSVADINYSLVAALNSAGLNASTVLLSTRNNGTVSTLYPVVGDFDYAIAKVDIGEKNYLLDASDPLLPFGTLPLQCLNDKGRVFSFDKPSYWIDLNLPQKETITRAIDLTLLDDGKIKGTITNYYIGYRAFEKRKEIKKFNSTDEYVEDLFSKLPKYKILKSEILNLDSLDLPLSEKLEVEINLFDKNNLDRIAFNPFFLGKIKENPFKLKERSYPVDWGMAYEDRSILIMHLPPNYEVEKAPLTPSVTLPNKGGRFLSSYEPDNNTFTFSNIIQISKPIYSSAEYPYLKEMYNQIIQTEKAEIVFKKKK